jgi:sigma-E factor negative regulatory protein RseB
MRGHALPAWIAGVGRWAAAGAFATSACANAPEDPMSWLQRITDSGRNTAYAGTFVHTNGNRTSTVRVTHRVVGGEEHERIEPLDGPPIEIVRKNEEMFCYLPDAKMVRLDRRVTARLFPSLFRAKPEVIARNYQARLDGAERIVGHECQWIYLEPKDKFRFAQRLCAEVATGLPLRAHTLNDKQQVIEQFTFTDLRIGGSASRGGVRSLFEARTKKWQTDARPLDEAKGADTGYRVSYPPAGFSEVSQMQRVFPGRPEPVAQIVLSDGLASMSVFVERTATAVGAETLKEEGALTFFVRPAGEYVITVLGEVPMAAAKQVARSITRKP